MSERTLGLILAVLAKHAEDALVKNLSFADSWPFAGAQLHKAPNGSAVISLQLEPEVFEKMADSHRYLDLFVLEPRSELGAHFHKLTTAHIYGISGEAIATVGLTRKTLLPEVSLVFNAGDIHNVQSDNETVVFASFQNFPIIQPDGTLDYFLPEDLKHDR